jgi:UDP-N-acetylglucosamine 2-epimerase
VEARLGMQLRPPTALVAYHPTTIARDTTREADALYDALESAEAQLLFCYPNADAGSRTLMARAESFAGRTGKGRVFVNLDPVLYWSLLRCVDLLVGNSSSGIMEAASFALPAVDVGIRQRGRERGRNVLDAEASAAAILDRMGVAMGEEFRRSLRGMENPYGDGHAAERIAATLAAGPRGEELLTKR